MLARIVIVIAFLSFACVLSSMARMSPATREIVGATASVPHSGAAVKPKAGPQIERLIKAFEGTWVITEELASDVSSPKGKTGAGTIIWRPGPGAYSVVEEYRSKQADQEINGLGTFWWDDAAQGYHTIWCDSTNPGGCIDFKNVARWDGPNLVLQEDYESNGKKFTFKEVFSDISITHFTQTLYGAEVGHELKVDQVIHAVRNMPSTSR